MQPLTAMTFYPVLGLCCTWSHVVVLPLAFVLSPVLGLHPTALPYALVHALHQCSLATGFVPRPECHPCPLLCPAPFCVLPFAYPCDPALSCALPLTLLPFLVPLTLLPFPSGPVHGITVSLGLSGCLSALLACTSPLHFCNSPGPPLL